MNEAAITEAQALLAGYGHDVTREEVLRIAELVEPAPAWRYDAPTNPHFITEVGGN